ncbi:MAG: glycerol-3-phosphate 1-O-acyltransferase PlsY [Planctomycetota bacterium]
MSFPLAFLAAAPPSDLPGGWLWLVAAYLLGSVPFGWLMAKLIKGVDIRTTGSGNIGATNAMRALGKPLGLIAFALDVFKGWAPVALLAPAAFGGEQLHLAQVLFGAAAVLGHVFPIYLGFKGGKAVATGCGALVGIDPLIFLISGLVWLATLGLTRMVGAASLAMSAAFPIVAWVRSGSQPYGFEVVAGAAALTLLVVIRHRTNIKRILNGTEPRVGSKNRGSDKPAAEAAPASTNPPSHG